MSRVNKIIVYECLLLVKFGQLNRTFPQEIQRGVGLLIDAVPESLVIGSLVTSTSGISVTFIAGVFLANFPEALSSSILMQARLSKARILLMWLL